MDNTGYKLLVGVGRPALDFKIFLKYSPFTFIL